MPTFLESARMPRLYQIPFVQLSSGVHTYQFYVDCNFFKEQPNGLLSDGEVNVNLEFRKSEGLFELTFDWDGFLITTCDNCLDQIPYPVKGKSRVSVKIQAEPAEDETDLIYLSPNEQELNVYPIIYDFLVLDLPMRKLCRDSNKKPPVCNPGMSEFLAQEEEDTDERDGRWDKLKELFNKDNNGSS